MRTVAEYLQNAEECRNLAKLLTTEEKEALEQMAQTWEKLAKQREPDDA
jgi:hypothetical protein